MVATPLHGWSTTILAPHRRQTCRRTAWFCLSNPQGRVRKWKQQMVGEFYCFLNLPLDELFDLKDRLRRFVQTAGKDPRTGSLREPGPA
jgi:hypothetical protein